jgi:hypothetical protein
MDLPKVLHELHEELKNLDAAIASLERLQEAAKHRGRPPNWLAEVNPPARAKRKRKAHAKAPQGDMQ